MNANSNSFSLSQWVLVKNEDYIRNNPPEFITHLNYVHFLAELTTGISVLPLNDGATITLPKILKNKANLIKLTKRNIDYEYRVVKENPEFAQVCASWMPVKSYYLLFNLITILRFLTSNNIRAISDSHLGFLKWLNSSIERKELLFNKVEFNQMHEGVELLEWKGSTGSRLKRSGQDQKEMLLSVLKKIQTYKVEDFRRKNGIENLRLKVNKENIKQFLSKNRTSLIEFFYWYRIKANYRDLEFLDKNISADHFNDYYLSYYTLTNNMYWAFKKEINRLCLKKNIELLEI